MVPSGAMSSLQAPSLLINKHHHDDRIMKKNHGAQWVFFGLAISTRIEDLRRDLGPQTLGLVAIGVSGTKFGGMSFSVDQEVTADGNLCLMFSIIKCCSESM